MNDITPKITRIDQLTQAASNAQKSKSVQIPENSFKKILEEQISAGELEQTTSLSSTLSEIQGSFTAQHLDLVSSLSTIDQTQLAIKLTDSLDLFERYAAFLGDPDKSLKQSRSMLEQVLEQTRTLTQDIDQYQGSQTDPASGLKDILTRLMTMARVEQIKLDRGDYL
ncbi:MAG: hypothetical protein ABIJ31_05715 [Pseudomonadota bacterium]